MTSWFDLNEDDERAVAAFMTRVAALPSAMGAADPMQVWWKAQLLRRWDAERRVHAPLDAIQPLEIAAGLGTAAFLLYLSLPYLR
ncbi:MAG: hypothetical protein FJW14_10530 [Acidimicrobiia bacterium]|nr:hypothetical protein [Acidimicrobiia bacterium]